MLKEERKKKKPFPHYFPSAFDGRKIWNIFVVIVVVVVLVVVDSIMVGGMWGVRKMS